MSKIRFQFGNVVVVNKNEIGVIVKAWAHGSYHVYVRNTNRVEECHESIIAHYIYGKELSEEEKEFYE